MTTYQLHNWPGNDQPWYIPCYRGLDRTGPIYNEALPDDHAFNRAWSEYIAEMNPFPELRDVERAIHFADEFRKWGVTNVDVIAVTNGPRAAKAAHTLLGYDVAYAHAQSLLSHVPLLPPWTRESTYSPLIHLVDEHFKSRLNEHGLFETYEEADYYLQCELELQRLGIGALEFDNYEVLAIELVVAAEEKR